MNLNKHIVVATLGLVFIGVWKHSAEPSVALTPIFTGSYIFMLALSVLDLAGGQASTFASAFAMLALVNGVLTEVDAAMLQQLAPSSGTPPKGTSPGGTGTAP